MLLTKQYKLYNQIKQLPDAISEGNGYSIIADDDSIRCYTEFRIDSFGAIIISRETTIKTPNNEKTVYSLTVKNKGGLGKNMPAQYSNKSILARKTFMRFMRFMHPAKLSMARIY